MDGERPMRRADRQISREEGLRILQGGEYGFLATADAAGRPYGVPMSYVVAGGALYIHCAKEGRKADNIRQRPEVSFTVVGRTRPVFNKNFSTLYESAMVFGRLAEVTDEGEKSRILAALAEKYLPGHLGGEGEAIIRRSLGRTAVYALALDHLTAKAKR